MGKDETEEQAAEELRKTVPEGQNPFAEIPQWSNQTPKQFGAGLCEGCGGRLVPRPRGCLWWAGMILFFPLSLLFLLAGERRKTQCERCGTPGPPICK